MAPNNNNGNINNNNKSMNNGAEKPKKKSRRRQVPKDSPEYQTRRDRNNVAVRKSRDVSKVKAKETIERVTQLRNENLELEQQVQLLAKELGVLKDLFKMSSPLGAASSVPGLEAAIQTDDGDIFGAQGLTDSDVKTEDFDFLDEAQGMPQDVEVNTRALQKDHEYYVKTEIY